MSRYDDDDDEQVIYVEREGGSSIKALLLGAVIGAGVALLFAPQSGEETRRGLKRRLRKIRAMAEEKVDELSQRFSGPDGDPDTSAADDGEEDEDLEAVAAGEPARSGSAREELERRLEKARARRRKGSAEESDA
jgi:gas vesicle protein